MSRRNSIAKYAYSYKIVSSSLRSAVVSYIMSPSERTVNTDPLSLGHEKFSGHFIANEW